MEPSIQPNLFAFLVSFSWPLVGIGLFLMFPPRWACAVTIIGGEMFLPARFGIHPSGLPLIDKDLIVSLSAIIGCLVVRPRAILGGNKLGRRYTAFILLMIVGAYLTVVTNPDPCRAGPRYLPGLGFHDFVSMTVGILLAWWPAFFLGRKLFTKIDDLEVICTVLAVGGVVYSLFIFVELWLSPQFNYWIYGYHVGTFDQTIRGGGYRPMVFMRHGLTLALFVLVTVLAATGLARARVRLLGISSRWLVVFLGFILISCHSVGALVNGLIFVPVLIWARPRAQTRMATAIGWLVLLYPILRLYDLLPVDSVVNLFTAVFGADRAGSLGFRFTNEDLLLKRALERPWFGWGGWGRNFLFNPWGGLASVVDGEWIAVMGTTGVVGFLGVFGLLIVPILVFAKRIGRLQERRHIALATAVLFISVAYVFDLLPNSGVAAYLMMIIGALAGIDVDAASDSDGVASYFERARPA
jgi:hypothetical protein